MKSTRWIWTIAAGAAWLAVAGAAEKRPPNILFAISDDQSFPHAGAYGCAWVKTPAFDSVAAGGLLFTRAYTPNPKCAPSRAIVLTGRNSWQLGAAANHVPIFPKEYKTYAEALTERGWHVGFTGKGWSPGDAQGRHLTGRAWSEKTLTPPTTFISKNDYAANFDEFLDARPEGQPFCFWYGSTEPHRAYEYGTGVSKGGKKLSDVDRVPGYWPDREEVRHDILDYAFEIEHFDLHLGRMIESLRRRGELDNTVIVVTADNGMPFPRCKGNMYERSAHMPFAIQWPAGIRNPGRTVNDYVSFADIAPTFLDLAGVSDSAVGMKPVAGRSLLDIFRGETATPPRDHVVLGQERHDVGRPYDWGYPIRGILQDDYLFVRNEEPMRWPACNPETGYLNTDAGATKTAILDARRAGESGSWDFWTLNFGRRPHMEMYHVASDPDCLTNLVARADLADRRAAMIARLDSILAAQGDLRMQGRGREYEAFPYANKASVNMYARFHAGEKVNTGWVDDSDYEKDFYRDPPSIRIFSATESPRGVILTWAVVAPTPDASPTQLFIEPGVGFLASDSGTVTVRPDRETVYTLTAINPKGTNTATVTAQPPK